MIDNTSQLLNISSQLVLKVRTASGQLCSDPFEHFFAINFCKSSLILIHVWPEDFVCSRVLQCKCEPCRESTNRFKCWCVKTQKKIKDMQGSYIINKLQRRWFLFIFYFLFFLNKDSIWVEKGKICMTDTVNCFGEQCLVLSELAPLLILHICQLMQVI